MDPDSVDRIRRATFPMARRGYDKREVERYLGQLADWLETGGGDEARSDTVRSELERIGEQTAAILTQAHDAAEAMRTQADREIRQQLADANLKAESMRSTADEYAQETREEADAYAMKMRSDVDAYAERVRIDADSYGEETRADAEGYAGRFRAEAEAEAQKITEAARAEAARIVEDGHRRKTDTEAMISDLEQRRDTVVAELERLASEVAGTATQHRPTAGGDQEPTADGAGAEEDAAPEKPEPKPKPRPKAKRTAATRSK
ncbi:MAG: DivIVA domain-containing protein [Solirubrobacterales bacterium]